MIHDKIGLNELKHCPFCGSGAILEEKTNETFASFLVRCGHCGCILFSSEKILLSNTNYDAEKERLIKKVIENWNNRL